MIQVVTDYHAGLPEVLIERFGIVRKPSTVYFGNKAYHEGPDFTPADFYHMLEQSQAFPVTEPPTADEFEAFFTDLLKSEKTDALLYICFSSKMSEIYNNAVEAAGRLPEGAVHVFDTLSVSIAEGLMARQAAEMLQNGQPLDAVLTKLNHMRDTSRIFFALNTLDYLEKGGRIGKAAALAGRVLNTHPVLTINDGEVSSYARFSSRVASLQNLKDILRHVGEGKKGLQIGVAHAVSQDEAQQLAEELSEMLDPAINIIGHVSPAVGAHAGPGALAVGWYIPDQSA